MISWINSNDRTVLMTGQLAVGAVFHPLVGSSTAWRWRMWLGTASVLGIEGRKPSLEAARTALLAAFRAKLAEAELLEVGTPE